jgi:hypothetical protein
MLSRGRLRFAYWAAFDDEVDYAPYLANSGSLTPEQLSGALDDQIEATLVREATSGYKRLTRSTLFGAGSNPTGSLPPHASETPPSGEGWTRVIDEYNDGIPNATVTVWSVPFDVDFAYGGNGNWVYGRLSRGTLVTGSLNRFFGSDPLVGVVKNLWARPRSFVSDTTSVFRPIFTMPQGQTVLPRVHAPQIPSGSVEMRLLQRPVQDVYVQRDSVGRVLEQLGPYDRGFERLGSTESALEIGYVPGSFPIDHQSEGFLVRVFKKTQDGFAELDPRLDDRSRLSYGNELIVEVSPGTEDPDGNST